MPRSRSLRIFLAYRREDAAPYARLLYSLLEERLPDEQVFMDVDSIEAGQDFAEVVRTAVSSSTLVVALIGRQWATLTDAAGRRRIDDPDDFVRIELQTALEHGVRVIPVLVDNAVPLRSEQLPAELRKLASLNALELSATRYQYDADRLIDLIQRVLAAASDTSQRAAYPAYVSQEPTPVVRGADMEAKAVLSHFDGRQFKVLHSALLASYTFGELERDLMFELDRRLDDISGPDNLSNIVFRVLKAAERQGWMLDLLRMLQASEYPDAREAAARILIELDRPQNRQSGGEIQGREPGGEDRDLPRRVKVFLCHSSSDKPSVRELYAKLFSDGIQPWLDEKDILPGEQWEWAIRKAIRASDMVLVCLSTESVSKRGYLQKEIKSVLDVADEQPEGNIFLIPVRLEPCDVPERLSKWQWVDLFEGDGYPRLMRSLQGASRR